jgi:hypothetical protein
MDMSEVLEKVMEEVQRLTPEERRQLIRALQAAGPAALPRRLETVDRVYGKYAHVRTSSEEFCARKPHEIALEDVSGRQ